MQPTALELQCLLQRRHIHNEDIGQIGQVDAAKVGRYGSRRILNSYVLDLIGLTIPASPFIQIRGRSDEL